MTAGSLGPVSDVESFARAHAVSREAVELLWGSDVFDLHLDSFIPPRLWGYDLHRRHGLGWLRGRFFGHLDFPRVREAGLTGGMWSITTNPFRTARGRWRVFQRNLERFRAEVARTQGAFELVRTHAEYLAARARGAHACLLAIQGGNALESAPEGPASVPDRLLTRVTLVHLTNSVYGVTSSPFAWRRKHEGLSDRGQALVRQLDQERVFVDLAHLNPQGFWDAVEVHDPSLPLIATHTGVCGVLPHWRNLDDRQIRAIADTGGTVGIIFATVFLRRPGGPSDAGMILEHLEHVISVAGEDFASIGSDYDGAITPPPGLRDGASLVRLVQAMLDRNWTIVRIQKVLGQNALRAFALLRP
jgi:membrane dipeptidase